MKIKTKKSDLLQALVASFKAAPTKASFPIMEDFLLVAKDGTLEVTATDGAMTIVASAPAEGEGKTCINARLFLEAVRLLPDTDIEMETKESTAIINYGAGTFELPIFPAEDFPDVEVPQTQDATLAAEDIKGALSYVLPSVAKDPMRPQLNGVFFNPVEKGYDVVSTDSKSLSIQTIQCFATTGPVIVPTILASFLRDTIKEGSVMFGETESKAVFRFDNIVVSVVKIIGKFPNYQAVLPKNNENKLSAPVADLLTSVRRVSTCANKSTNAVKFTLSALGDAVIEAQDIGFKCSAREDVNFVSYEGEDLTIGFKYDLLCNLLGAVEENTVTLAMGNPRQATLITSDNDSRMAVIMPVSIA